MNRWDTAGLTFIGRAWGEGSSFSRALARASGGETAIGIIVAAMGAGMIIASITTSWMMPLPPLRERPKPKSSDQRPMKAMNMIALAIVATMALTRMSRLRMG